MLYIFFFIYIFFLVFFFFFSSRRRHTRWTGDWSSDVCSSDLLDARPGVLRRRARADDAGRGARSLGDRAARARAPRRTRAARPERGLPAARGDRVRRARRGDEPALRDRKSVV